jgi:peptidoglycan/xylan/chitin deacetylase (PgdA/CDA1 family)
MPGRARPKVASPAHFAGYAAILSSAALFPFGPPWAAAPLACFVLACAAASLSPRSRFYMPVISRGHTGRRAVALTFDDGPDPLTTPLLLATLSKHRVKAAFFVSGRNAVRHPELVRQILGDGHEVGNHSCSHDPFLMLYPYRSLSREIGGAQDVLAEFGIRPLAFRPPVGLTNPKLPPVLDALGMFCVTFSCRSFDRGNRRIDGMAARIMKRIRPDDIVLLHDVRPRGENGVPRWLQEIEVILDGLAAKDLQALPLGELIGRPVMETHG